MLEAGSSWSRSVSCQCPPNIPDCPATQGLRSSYILAKGSRKKGGKVTKKRQFFLFRLPEVSLNIYFNKPKSFVLLFDTLCLMLIRYFKGLLFILCQIRSKHTKISVQNLSKIKLYFVNKYHQNRLKLHILAFITLYSIWRPKFL